MSKLLKKIQLATELGGQELNQFSSVAGMTANEFKKAFETDAVGALSAFIDGLNNTERNGKSAIAVLDDMGLTEVRLSNTILSLANASGVGRLTMWVNSLVRRLRSVPCVTLTMMRALAHAARMPTR